MAPQKWLQLVRLVYTSTESKLGLFIPPRVVASKFGLYLHGWYEVSLV